MYHIEVIDNDGEYTSWDAESREYVRSDGWIILPGAGLDIHMVRGDTVQSITITAHRYINPPAPPADQADPRA